jgi:hypothetical protein
MGFGVFLMAAGSGYQYDIKVKKPLSIGLQILRKICRRRVDKCNLINNFHATDFNGSWKLF